MNFTRIIIFRVHYVTNHDYNSHLVYIMEARNETQTYGVKTSTIVTMDKFKWLLTFI